MTARNTTNACRQNSAQKEKLDTVLCWVLEVLADYTQCYNVESLQRTSGGTAICSLLHCDSSRQRLPPRSESVLVAKIPVGYDTHGDSSKPPPHVLFLGLGWTIAREGELDSYQQLLLLHAGVGAHQEVCPQQQLRPSSSCRYCSLVCDRGQLRPSKTCHRPSHHITQWSVHDRKRQARQQALAMRWGSERPIS